MRHKLTLPLISSIAIVALHSCSEKQESEHVHGPECNHGESSEHQHGPGCNHSSHDEHADCDATAGPNGGRMLDIENLNVELLVTEQKHIKLNFFDPEMAMVKPTAENIKVTTGEAISPVTLEFKPQGISMLSTQVLPEGDAFPTKVELNVNGKTLSDEFTLKQETCSH